MRIFNRVALIALACTGLATTGAHAVGVLYEEALAHEEEARMIANPIGGIENKFWFNYRANVNEARKELVSDLRHASDIEDRRDAWEEYGVELSHERHHYIEEMAERGVRFGTVTVGK